MSGYAFSSEQVALFLRDYANSNLAGQGGSEAALGREIITAKTPATGIAAISGTTVSYGDCTRAYISEIELNESPSIVVPVINISADAIAGNAYIQAARVGSCWVAIAGGGGGGGTDTAKTFQFKTTTAISAGDPTDGTVGSGSANLWTFNGTQFAIDSSALYDIVNPWATTVSTDKMITAYQDLNHPDKYILVQSECEESSNGGDNGGGDTDPLGYCIDDTTGLVTENVAQSACTGTWSSTEPTTGCCDIGGTENANVAESWCTTQGGTFTAGACPPAFDHSAERARFKATSLTFADQTVGSCATTPWNVSALGSMIGFNSQTGDLKRTYQACTVSSSENPAGGTAILDINSTYNSSTGNWDLVGEVRYNNSSTGGTTDVEFVGTLSNTLSACGTTISGNITGLNTGNYAQACDSTDGTAISGSITLELECI